MTKGYERAWERLNELREEYTIEEYCFDEFDGLYWSRCVSLEVYTEEEGLKSFAWTLATGVEI